MRNAGKDSDLAPKELMKGRRLRRDLVGKSGRVGRKEDGKVQAPGVSENFVMVPATQKSNT